MFKPHEFAKKIGVSVKTLQTLKEKSFYQLCYQCLKAKYRQLLWRTKTECVGLLLTLLWN
jgi:hypothetical protein